jgi:hypothetical protein
MFKFAMLFGVICLGCATSPAPDVPAASPESSARQPAARESAAVVAPPTTPPPPPPSPATTAEPQAEEWTSVLAKANQKLLTDPVTGRPVFETDPLDLASVLPAREDAQQPLERYWGLEVQTGVKIEPELVSGKYLVVYITPERITRGPEYAFQLGRGSDERQENTPSTQARTHVFDYDGDGGPELVLAVDHGVPGRAGWKPETRIFTRKKGKVTLYPPSAKLRVLVAEDIDDDSRPDLWLDKNGKRVAARSLTDGTFSTSDPIARRATADDAKQ